MTVPSGGAAAGSCIDPDPHPSITVSPTRPNRFVNWLMDPEAKTAGARPQFPFAHGPIGPTTPRTRVARAEKALPQSRPRSVSARRASA